MLKSNSNPMRIVITHGLPDDNPGGCAIALGMIRALKLKFPNSVISLISYYGDQKKLPKIHRYLLKNFPDLELLPTPIPSRIEAYSGSLPFARYLRGIKWITGIVCSTMKLLLPAVWLRSKTYNRIKQADIVLSRGTQIFYDKPRFPMRNFISLYWITYPILIAKKLRKRYVIYAHSFGPLKKPSSVWLIKKVLQLVDLILVRENISRRFLLSLGISDKKIVVVPDAAFGIAPSSEETTREIVNSLELPFRKYLTVTVRKWRDACDSTPFLNKMSQLIDSILEANMVEKCVIVTHVRCGPASSEDDTHVSQKLFELIRNKDKTMLINKEFSPAVLVSLYSGAKLMIGTRLHSVLMALIGGTPSIAISYSGPKTHGIMQMLGMQEFVVNMGDLDTNRTLNLVCKLVDNNSKWRNMISKKVSYVRERALTTPDLLFQERI
ncbi:MAG: polysaccharide pyruvyl transferase family protein [bacterium]